MTKSGFENLRIYKLAEEIADMMWEIVTKWDYFAKDTVGKQLVNSADSIGANLAEGYGRGSHADNRRFAKISRGSLFEVKHWLRRAYTRNLLEKLQGRRCHSENSSTQKFFPKKPESKIDGPETGD